MPASRRTATGTPDRTPKSCHARSAASRSLAARRIRLRRRVLVNPAAGTVAVDADGGQVNDRSQMARARQRVAEGEQDRVALRRLGNGDQRAVGLRNRRHRCPASPRCRRTRARGGGRPRVRSARRRVPRCARCRRCGQNRRRTWKRNAPPNSRARNRVTWTSSPHLPRGVPFGDHAGIGLAARGSLSARSSSRAIEPRERPDRGAPHQRRGIVEQALGLGRQRGFAGVADRDQHIAHEPLAADALDGALAEQRAERRIVEPGQIRRVPVRAARRARQASPRGRPARICSTDRPRGNRRSHRCGCRSADAARAGSALYARW